jgi:hypothetical protein
MLSRYPRLSFLLLVIFFLFAWVRLDLGHQAADDREVWTFSTSSSLDEIEEATQPTPTVAVTSPSLEVAVPTVSPNVSEEPSPNAYVFYATDDAYACSVLVNIRRLQNDFDTPYRIFVLATVDVHEAYLESMEALGATVSIQDPPRLAKDDVPYYRGCLMKMLGFKMHKLDPTLKRVLVLDADQLVMQSLDHVFDLPEVDLAAPRAYWLSKDFMTSAFMLITLSDRLWDRVDNALTNIEPHRYDMDLVNDLLGDTVLMLPGEYVTLNGHWESWRLPDWYRPEVYDQTDDDPMTPDDAWNTINTNEEPHGILEKDDQITPREEENAPHTDGRKRVRRQLKALQTEVEKKPQGKEQDQASGEASTDDVSSTSHASKSSKLDSESTSSSNPSKSQPSDADNSKPEDEDHQSKAPEFRKIPKDENHPNYQALFTLYHNATKVLHFSAVGKPWSYDVESVEVKKPNGHPVLLEQFRYWRQLAMEVCPSIDYQTSNGRHYESKLVEWV